MTVQLAAAATSFVTAFLIVPVIIKYSLKKNLGDSPGRRKVHKKVTPSMGGIAIFLGFIFSSLIWVDFSNWGDIKLILASLFVIFFLGVRDDLVPLRALVKLMGQIMAASLLIFLFDLRITSFYGLFGIGELHYVTSVLVTYFTVVVITNSFNLIDGLDGLAGSIASVTLFSFGLWYFFVGEIVLSVLAFSMLGSILAFLIFNWEPSEVFMGDTGALVIGMMLAIMTINFIEINHHLDQSNAFKFSSSIGTATCFILIPLADTLRIFILRLMKRQSPFKPDKSHIHHAMLRLGLTHAQTTIVLTLVQAIFVMACVIFNGYSEHQVLFTIIAITFVLSVTLDRKILSRL